MSKQSNSIKNPMSPYTPKPRAVGSVVTNQATGKGGFKSGGDTTTSNMYGILSGNFESK